MVNKHDQQFADFENVPEPSEPEEPHTWIRYKIWDQTSQADKNVAIFCSTNDNLDTGYPGEHASWVVNYDNLKSAIEHTGITRTVKNHVVYVFLNGTPLHTKDVETHRFIGDILSIRDAFLQAFDIAEKAGDAKALLEAHDLKNEALGTLIKEHKELLERLIEKRSMT